MSNTTTKASRRPSSATTNLCELEGKKKPSYGCSPNPCDEYAQHAADQQQNNQRSQHHVCSWRHAATESHMRIPCGQSTQRCATVVFVGLARVVVAVAKQDTGHLSQEECLAWKTLGRSS